MTFSSYIPKLKGNAKTINIGAKIDGKPVGLLIIEKERGKAKILSIFVTKENRKKNVGKGLIEMGINTLIPLGLKTLEIEYCSSLKESKDVELFFKKIGWGSPRRTDLVVRCSRALKKSKYFNKNIKFPQGFNAIDWKQISKEDLLGMKSINSPKYLSPLENIEKVYSDCSFILKKGEEVIGWMIAYEHFAGVDAIDFGKLFIVPKMQGKGLGFLLMAHSIKKFFSSKEEDRVGFFKLNFKNKVMIKMYKAILRDYVISEEEMLKFTKKII